MQIRPYLFKSKLFLSFSVIILLSALCAYKATAQGDLLVTPKRLIFEGSKRSQELNLANIGNDSATYIISFLQYRMKEDGTFEAITQPDSNQLFADKYLRIFPRTITLGPKEAQTVKVQLTKVNSLVQGEYRSHIYFRAVPKEKPLGEKEPVKDSTISIKLIPIFGISIPAIVRVGEYNSEVALSDISVQMEKDTIPVLKLNFNRKGSMSVYGDLYVDYIANDGKSKRVGLVKGLAVYTPNTLRRFNLMLDKSVDYHTGKLHLTYTDQSPKPATIAEQEVILSKQPVANVASMKF